MSGVNGPYMPSFMPKLVVATDGLNGRKLFAIRFANQEAESPFQPNCAAPKSAAGLHISK